MRGLGLRQDRVSVRGKATSEGDGVGWLEAWGASLVEAMQALQARAPTTAVSSAARREAW